MERDAGPVDDVVSRQERDSKLYVVLRNREALTAFVYGLVQGNMLVIKVQPPRKGAPGCLLFKLLGLFCSESFHTVNKY